MQNFMQKFEKTIQLNNKKARYYDLSTFYQSNNNQPKQKPTLHFYGGNGFTAGVYQPLLVALSEYFNVISLAMRGYWYDLPQDKVMTRQEDANCLIEFLEKTQKSPVVGIGHSQGASATALAAAKRPDLFSQLYLIDPVTFTKPQEQIFKRIPRKVLMAKEPFKSALNKPENYKSIDEYYQQLRQNRAYRRISDDNLKLFAKNSLFENKNGGYTLIFKPKYELASYFGTPYITSALKRLNKIDLPYSLILAKPSMFNSEKVRKSWKRVVPKECITVLSDYGHLLPMEVPNKCADIIIDQFNNIKN